MKAMPMWWRPTVSWFFAFTLYCGCRSLLAQDDPSVAVEAIRRLKGTDLSGSPALNAAVHKVLDRVVGTPAMVEIVTEFDIQERLPDVLEFMRKNPTDESMPQAVRWVGKTNPRKLDPLLEDPGVAVAFLEAIGRSGGNGWVTQLGRIAGSSQRPDSQREAAVQALIGSEAGAIALLNLAESGGLPPRLLEQALLALKGSRYEAARRKAVGLQSGTGKPGERPDRDRVLAIRGDPAVGQRLFRSDSAGCLACHRVGREGSDFGPALDGIGSKLGKDALYDAIVDPSSGIGFGYEAWLLTLADGEELLGLLASETGEEIVLRVQGGQTIRTRREAVVRKEKQPKSIMPDGLLDGRKPQEAADLIAYLTTLKASDAGSTSRE